MSSEQSKNVFSKFYTVPCTANEKEEKSKKATPVQKELKMYKHQDAIEFAESTSHSKQVSSCPELPTTTDYKIKEFESESGVRAYYRVVLKTQDSYALSACHANVHGHHRGDLRFIEVNSRTVTRGSEKSSVIGKLFLGDIVAVKELIKLSHPVTMDVFQVTPDQRCSWMASKITVLKRKILNNVTFSILNQNADIAVMKEQSELMTIPSGLNLQVGDLYYGSAFVPEKIISHFCEGYKSEHRNQIIALCSKVHQPPNPLGTIFEMETSSALNEMFEIGTNAFNKYSKHSTSPSEIAETCILMGYAAANAVSYGRLDSRQFPIQNANRMGRVLQFYIDNPTEEPTEGKWAVGNRVQIVGATGGSSAVIESVLVVNQTLKLTVRLSKDVSYNVKFDNGLYIVSQREPLDIQVLKSGFFDELPAGCNSRRILEALYGGAKISAKQPWNSQSTYPAEVPIELNKYQAEYVSMLKDRANHPIVVASSPFGCGKSMTIVTAAMEGSRAGQMQLLVTQSNFASVNLVEIARKIVENENNYYRDFKIVRYITEKNAKELPEDCLTDYDLPKLTERVFTEWARGKHQGNKKVKSIPDHHKFVILNIVFNHKLVQPDELVGEAKVAYSALKKRGVTAHETLNAFLALYKPSVILSTADSLQNLFSSNMLARNPVSTIQIDEASQLPEYTFIRLLTRFPNANYGLIGDIQQLPPYCETGLDGKLKDFGIGNTMERAVAGDLFPQAMLREVYRCHPKTTGLLSELFYDGQLVSGIPESKRSQFMLKRSDFWPNPNFPVMVVNNQGKTQRMGTSCGNTDEQEIVKQLLDSLTEEHGEYKLENTDIGVISFYKGQTSMLTDALRGTNVKCGTVDAFQGSEKEVIILCCTNEVVSEFMQLGNRLNVAMSRAKQTTIIVGNVDGLRKAKHWSTIVERVEQNGCVIEPAEIGKISPSSRPAYREEVRPTAKPEASSWGESSDSWDSGTSDSWTANSSEGWSTTTSNSWDPSSSTNSWDSNDVSNLAQGMENVTVTEAKLNKRRPKSQKNYNQEKPREQLQTRNQGFWRFNRQAENSNDCQDHSYSRQFGDRKTFSHANEENQNQAKYRPNGYGRDNKSRELNDRDNFRQANDEYQNNSTYRKPHRQQGPGSHNNRDTSRSTHEESPGDNYRRPYYNNGSRHQPSPTSWEGEEQGYRTSSWSNRRN